MMKSLLISIVFLSFTISTAQALPLLQLDADPGVYVGGSEESTVTSSLKFDLIALLDAIKMKKTAWTAYSFFVSIALTPTSDPGGTIPNLGSFVFGGTTYNTTDMVWGTPPVAIIAENADLPGHGIFPALYKEIGITFESTSTTPAYNVQDGTTSQGSLLMSSFAVDLAGLSLAEGVGVHFDLYGYIPGDDMVKSFFNAPFSHDVSVAPIPEPATILLFGTGLVGLMGIARRKKK